MTVLNFIRAFIYGVIQGITEWLPISSTGHLILANEIPFFKLDGISQDFFNMFIVVIQLASILAVILIYFNKLNPFSKHGLKKTPCRCGLRL